ncbi:MAG TPA: hypothetical protein VM327_04720 [Candidatus Thermoplasmatota archaeon]|nr:hypothetical protein [Candidatus Thermoplasmatota archaeon]
MMKTAASFALLVLAALAVPTGSAQAPQGILVTATDLAAPIPYEGSAQLPVSVQVGCVSILQNQGSTTVEVTATDAPAWLTVTPASVDVQASTCATGGTGFATGTGAVGLAVSKDAPGVVDHTIDLVGTLGSEASGPVPVVFTVAYHVNYTLVPDAKFPLTVNGTEASFNVTVTQASNARSMVMIEGMKSSAGVFSGLGSQVYESDAGKPATKTFKVTFKAPDGEWSNATAQFTAYGHYLLLDGRAGDFDAGTPVTYAFVAGEHHHDEGGDKDSPAPVGAFVALGLVALAAIARRRA